MQQDIYVSAADLNDLLKRSLDALEVGADSFLSEMKRTHTEEISASFVPETGLVDLIFGLCDASVPTMAFMEHPSRDELMHEAKNLFYIAALSHLSGLDGFLYPDD
ncbi:hypothetical protein BMI91_19540 [Thioclava sediminum]|uniref:Acyl carrier protein n=1 Tax=Thioclava sediminum TaxID=1915319 RepID=A0ABX3MS01_9RHOB|nr:hypothetical protein [Thioclava sediminum]OOY22477.1 hypothetical protein BMI91_19540 [Thioclava sediminum]